MNILFATDGSESARAAGRLLAALQLPPDSRLVVLSAMPAPSWVETQPTDALSLYPWAIDLSTAEEASARRAAEAAAAPLRERGVGVTIRIPRQSPAAAILGQAEAEGADLIVVGSHGSGALERQLVGSVSERVARYAHCSVLVARRETLRRVLVAVDCSEASEQALDVLTRLPLPPGTAVTALHVIDARALHALLSLVPGLNSESVTEKCDRAWRAMGVRIVREAQERLRVAGYAVDTEVCLGHPLEQIVAAAWRNEADLIVLGAENRSALGRRFLGCVSGCVLAHAPCSVLVARSTDPHLEL